MRTVGVRRLGAAVVAAVASLSLLAGCGSGSEPSPPSGVDGLTIPTPDPSAADFVKVVDNPWFPLPVGARWRYRGTSAAPAKITVTAEAGPRVAGVQTTTRVRVGAHGDVTRDHYAQDRAGNVWWFGREGEWEAGADGVEAGLAMPAVPRRGDGFRTGPHEVATVEDLDEQVEVSSAAYPDTVVLATTSEGITERDVYARGVGLVQTTTTGLVAFDEPR
ncbi:MAG: hypothetical protein L0H31_15840 [Nocardioidaceae bacterium]|nr:hypothetical protein [Nocardioidaceae bacterium]